MAAKMMIEYPVKFATVKVGSNLSCTLNQIPKIVFSVNPVKAEAQALTKIISPKKTWTSRYEALRWSFRPGNRKMRKPETHCKENNMTVRSPTQEWKLYIFGMLLRLWKSNTAMSAMTQRMKIVIIITAWAIFKMGLGPSRKRRYIRIPFP